MKLRFGFQLKNSLSEGRAKVMRRVVKCKPLEDGELLTSIPRKARVHGLSTGPSNSHTFRSL